MKKVRLSRNQFALVDNEDFERVNEYKWCAMPYVNKKGFYAMSTFKNSKKHLHLSRFILNMYDESLFVDHIDRNGLNNQKSNLRIATKGQNMHNRKFPNRSGLKGVNWDNSKGKWKAEIQHNKKRYTIGRFKDPIEAAKAYDKKARELFGDFAFQNFPKKK